MHFDGHGELTGGGVAANAPDNSAQPGTGIGVLVFEDLGGGEDQVSADRIAQILADAQVPVIVLNACQSGAVGKELEAAVGHPAMLGGGASAVVAMAYSVYAVAAAEFMAAFYERLFAGATVSESVAAGRARMRQQPNRPSPKGKVPLQDWLVPVHYLRKEIRFPHLHQQPQARPPGISLGDALSALEADDTLHPTGNADALTAVDEFVGRDGLFYTIEVAARTQHVIVLHGLGGTGKTELAKAFGRWWQRTDGVDDPDWVIWHSFEPEVASFGLDGVLDEIGLQLLGTDFVRTEPTRRRPLIQRLLQQHRLLVILDNFETVRTMPDPTSSTPTLDEAGLIELQQFLENIAADSRSTVLITSRTPEHWLGPHIRRVLVGGLTPEEADSYTDQLLAPFPAARPRRAHPDYPALLEWLNGHPLAMRLTLPHLDHTSPDQLLANLQGIHTEDGDEPETGADRRSSLTASIGYSLSHLDTTDQQLVHVVGLFRGVADADVLNNFSNAEHTPHRFRGIDVDRWAAILDRATDLGMLTDIGAGIYLIHPALPAQLIRHWRTQHPDTFDAEYADTQGALLEAFAYFGGWLDREIDSGDAARAYEFVNHHRRNLGYYLGYALNHQHWLEAQAIALPLYSYWERSGQGEEAETWTDRLLSCLEAADGSPPPLDQPTGYLWLFATNQVGERQLWAHQLDDAESTFRRIHEMLKQLPDTRRTQLRLQATYQRLGMVARERPQYDAAQTWYNKALAISHKLGSQTSIASAYRLLGGLARDRRRYDDAERWYHKALTISRNAVITVRSPRSTTNSASSKRSGAKPITT